MTQRTDILLPVGRFVAGSLTTPQTTDAEGRPLLVKTGAQTGQPREDWFFAVAIPKAGFASWWDTEWGKQIYGVGAAAFPNHIQSPKFAWKVSDGDSTIPNTKGKKPCDREGYPGNFIVHLSSGFAPKTYNKDGSASIDAAVIKPGHWLEVQCNVVGNGSTQQPGVFINHSMIAYAGYGDEINLGADASAVGFGKTALPPGATAVPTGSLPSPSATPAPTTPTPPAVVPTVPHPGILAGPPKHTMLPAAQGATYEACIAAGWTDDLLVANGMMQA